MKKHDKIFDEFIDHLFPHERCRQYVLNYMHLMLTTRNGNNTALCLVGRKGTGKGIFVTLCKELIGPSNFNKAQRGFFGSGFNKILMNKQLIHLDEQPINTAAKVDMFKDYCNNEHNLESKGVDADKTIETFFQFILTVNRDVDLKIEQDDRRYSVPDITDILLRKERGGIWSDVKIKRLMDTIADPDKLRGFGEYILKECGTEEWGTEDAWMGPKFERLCQVSLWEWQKFVLDTLLERRNDFYPVDKLKLMYKEVRSSTKSNISRDTLNDFLIHYRYEGFGLGSVEKQDRKWGIKPAKEFMPGYAGFNEVKTAKVETKKKRRSI